MNAIAPLTDPLAGIAPDDVALRFSLAEEMQATGLPQAAVALLEPAIATRPDHLPSRVLLGIALADLGETARAIAVFRAVVARAPDEPVGWTNLGMLLKVEGRFDEAVAALDRAVALRPEEPQFRLNRAVALLRAGRWAEAWPDFESRLLLGNRPARSLDRLLPALAGGVDLRGRTVLLTHGEGFGDTIQFLRYVRPLGAMGARVLLAVPECLAALSATTGGTALPPGAPLPDYDYQCPIMSLPRAFGATVENVPAAPFLAPDPARVARWRERMGPGAAGALRIGLCWAGQARPWLDGFGTLDARRSLALASLAPLSAVAGAVFVSLQMGPPAAQTPRPPSGMTLIDPTRDIADFADTAALIATLDAVVTVDTSVAHVAGAIGARVLLLDRYDGCWRWLAARPDTPWYPATTVFRQDRIGEWSGPVRQATATLQEMAATKRYA